MHSFNHIGIDFREIFYLWSSARKLEGIIFGEQKEKKINLGRIDVYIYKDSKVARSDHKRMIKSYKDEAFRYVIIDTIILQEEHKKKGIGLIVVDACCDFATPSDVVIINPVPIVKIESQEEGRKKLQEYWSRIDFKQIEGTDFFVRMIDNLCDMCKRCGNCCTHQVMQAHGIFSIDGVFPMTYNGKEVCTALRGEIGVKTWCAVYSFRPKMCREFACPGLKEKQFEKWRNRF